ncbi:MAG: prolipoprotein diacylglyceryl transferase family protein [Anaerolineae bacterium]|jgi:prolipoprotein diacylglyceryltransferase|nr:prolipoprotein diacylglyceryl transferase family protein [Anaerolineae bacterium]
MGFYAIMTGIGASFGLWRIYQNAPLEQRNEYLNDGLLVQFFILIGARLGYVAQYWNYFQTAKSEIFLLESGGLTLWGAITGGILGFILVCLISERQIFQIADALSPMLAPMAIFTWLASWRVGVAYGEFAPHDVWWALPTVDEFGSLQYRFPLQVAAAIATLLPFMWLETVKPFNGIVGMQASMSVVVLGGTLSLFMLQRADANLMIWNRSPAMLSSVILLGVGILSFVWITVREIRRE